MIVYSLGNFATYGNFVLSDLLAYGAILEVAIDKKGHFRSGKIIPLKQVSQGNVQVDRNQIAVDLIRLFSEMDFPKSQLHIAKDGTMGLKQKDQEIKVGSVANRVKTAKNNF